MKRFPKSLLTTLFIFQLSLFAFHNSCAQWEAVNDGQALGFISSLVVKGNKIFAGTTGTGPAYGCIYASSDWGQHWIPADSGLNNAGIKTLAVKRNMLFAGTASNGIFKSSDEGNTWNAVNTGLTNLNINFIKVSGNKIYTGTRYGLFVSDDDGESWGIVSEDLPKDGILDIEIIGNVMYAITQVYAAYPWNISNVFRSIDNGQNWSEAKQGLTSGQLQSMSSLATDGIYIYMSNHYGVSRSPILHPYWTLLDIDYTFSSAFAQNIEVYHNKIYVNVIGRGIFASSDAGVNWTKANNGLCEYQTTAITFHESDIIIATPFAIYASDTANFFWKKISPSLQNSGVLSMTSNASGVYAATTFGVFHSVDYGNHWNTRNNGLSVYRIDGITGDNNELYVFQGVHGIHRSVNQGLSWEPFNDGLPLDHLNMFEVRGIEMHNTKILSIGDSGKVYLNPGNGAAWATINSNVLSGDIYDLASQGNTIYAGTSKGLFKTSNDGASWSKINTGFSQQGVSLVYVKDNFLYVSSWNEGLFVSADSGNTLTAINDGLSSAGIRRLISDGSNLFLATADSGLFYSINNGNSWHPFNEGMPGNTAFSFTIKDNYIFAGTYGRGIYRRYIPEILGIKQKEEIDTPVLYPNPASNVINLIYKPLTNNAVCELASASGIILIKTDLAASGTNNFNISHLAPGIYFVRIHDGQHETRHKLVKY